ncbi:MAG: hypothetical protein A2Y25_00770 [Candidatus Melainabacteria bacterium GWF2_37_15]|nr:MAG: hypothetical protein A2Y25_00770 [Candidatus Melainabacteria bacterium GWF2_37_15]
MKRRQGFTLLELMIVVVILGVLALIAVPALLNAAEQSRESVMAGNVSAAASTLGSRLAVGTTIDAAAITAMVADLNASSANPFDDTQPAYVANAACGNPGEVGIAAGAAADSYDITGCDSTSAATITKTVFAPEDAVAAF